MRQLFVFPGLLLFLLSVPAPAASLDDFLQKSDEQVTALKLSKSKLNGLLKSSPKSIVVDSATLTPYHSAYDPSPPPRERFLGDDEPLDARSAKCVLQQVAELKKLNKELSSLPSVSYHINVWKMERNYNGYEFPSVKASNDGQVTLSIGLGIEDNFLGPCRFNDAAAIREQLRSSFSAQIRTKAEEIAPANEEELRDALKNTSFHPATPDAENIPVIDSMGI